MVVAVIEAVDIVDIEICNSTMYVNFLLNISKFKLKRRYRSSPTYRIKAPLLQLLLPVRYLYRPASRTLCDKHFHRQVKEYPPVQFKAALQNENLNQCNDRINWQLRCRIQLLH